MKYYVENISRGKGLEGLWRLQLGIAIFILLQLGIVSHFPGFRTAMPQSGFDLMRKKYIGMGEILTCMLDFTSILHIAQFIYYNIILAHTFECLIYVSLIVHDPRIIISLHNICTDTIFSYIYCRMVVLSVYPVEQPSHTPRNNLEPTWDSLCSTSNRNLCDQWCTYEIALDNMNTIPEW